MKTKDMAYISLFAAMMIALAWIPAIPLSFTPVPITVQTLGVMLTGILLGSRLGFMSQGLFLLLIAIGIPGLSGGRGGFSVFLGPSAGYLIGWALAALVIGLIIEKGKTATYGRTAIACLIGGIGVVYLVGIPVQAFIMKAPIWATFLSSLSFIPGDLVKVVIATILGTRLLKANALNIERKQAA